MEYQFPHGILKFVKDFQYHLEYCKICTFSQVIFDVVHYYSIWQLFAD